jgi:Tfp pilus assembly protein PilX
VRQSKFSRQHVMLGSEEGIAMLTVLMLTIILTVIGIAAITTTSLDIKMAGGERIRETSVQAAESCMSSSVQIIQQTLTDGAIPASLLPGLSSSPCIGTYDPSAGTCTTKALGTAPGQNPLQAEIMGQSDGNPDSGDPSTYAAPATAACPNCNAVLTVPGYVVNVDIDRLFARPKAGSALQFAAGYSGTAGGAAGGGIEILYRIDCYASSFVGGAAQAAGHVTGVYACVSSGQSCQRKI